MSLNKKESVESVTVMILAGGKISEEFSSIFGNLPSALVPVNNKPAIFWTIEKFINDGFKKFLICVGYEREKVKTFVRNNFGERANIEFFNVNFKKKPGFSFTEGTQKIKTKKLLLILGDTFIYNNIFNKVNLKNDFLLTSESFLKEESCRWALAKEAKGYLSKIFDKVKFEEIEKISNFKKLKLIIGVYYFSCVDLLKKITKKHLNKNIEISTILEEYNKFRKIRVIDYKDWFDFGHLDRYYLSAKKLLSYNSRYFNFLEYDERFGFITKKSQEIEKLNNEINWYLSLPADLSILAPRLINYKKGKSPFLSIEYYSYPALSEIYVFGEIRNYIWKNIIDRLIRTLILFKKYRGRVNIKEYYKIYFDKLESRLEKLFKINKKFQEIFQLDYIIINGKKYFNYKLLKEKIFLKIKELYSKEDNCFLHGDFCLSNILYDIKSGIVRLIDPRGKWADSLYGDLKYDVAKLRHSLRGQYDFIVNNLFIVKIENNHIKYKIFSNKNYPSLADYFDREIKKYWSIENIKFIEGLLFLSMLPLHNDYFERQLVMYSIGIQRINEVLVKK